MIPGEIIPRDEPRVINDGLPQTKLSIANTGDVPTHLSAHFHIFEANPRLRFDRARAWGMRLDVATDESVRIEPGATVVVSLVPIGGARIVRGFNGAVAGPLDEIDPAAALCGLVARGFLHEHES
ncbi:MAG TPA: urease subunit beta [Thermomicrobiales bacterium]|nr:urease subunit beta [Thermomicrobiales bacterium]